MVRCGAEECVAVPELCRQWATCLSWCESEKWVCCSRIPVERYSAPCSVSCTVSTWLVPSRRARVLVRRGRSRGLCPRVGFALDYVGAPSGVLRTYGSGMAWRKGTKSPRDCSLPFRVMGHGGRGGPHHAHP
eukprot:7386106-Prymnesium_polylepis.1